MSTTSASVCVGVGVPTVCQDRSGVVGGDGDGLSIVGIKNTVSSVGLPRIMGDVGLDDAE